MSNMADDENIMQQIRKAQGRVSSPVAIADFEDALLHRVVERLTPVLPGAEVGHAAFAVLDSVMPRYRERVKERLAEIEKWAKDRVRMEGIALASSSDVLAAALIARFGGSVEIPAAELAGIVKATTGYSADEDEERNVVRFAVIQKTPSSED
jgi:hypothetical protein